MSQRSLDLPFLMVLSATVGLSFKGIFAKLAFAVGMTVAGVLMLRIFLALPLYWLAVRLLPKATIPATARDWRDALLVGSLFTLSTAADFMAIDRLGAGLSRIILFTFPLLVQLISAVRARRMPTQREMVVFALCYAGLILLFVPKGLAGRLDADLWIGIACGFTAAISYALFLLLAQGLSTRLGSARFTAMANTGTFLVFATYGLIWAGPADFALPAVGLVWVVLMVVLSTVLPFLLLFEGIRRTGAERASLIALTGPAVTVLTAWLLLGESLVLVQWLGFALVVVGMGWLQVGSATKPAR